MDENKKSFETNVNSSKSINEELSSSTNYNNIISQNSESILTIYDFMKKRQSEWIYKEEIIENEFLKLYKNFKQLMYIDKQFYSLDGEIREDFLKKELHEILENADCNKGLSYKVNSLFASLKNKCLSNYTMEDNVIFTTNQKLKITKENGIEFLQNETTTNRLNAQYIKDYEKPYVWLKFLNDMFDETSILILQQFLGYCLLANISAQKMLLIIGESGIGKSRIGIVLKTIFGTSFLPRLIKDLFNENNKFSLANAANKLIYYSDEISAGYTMTDSSRLRILITGGDEKSEQKNEKELTFTPFGKVIAMGNYNFKVMKEDIPSIKRRSIILKTKDKDPNRIDNKLLDKDLLKEKDLIFNWMVDGAVIIVQNGYNFSHDIYIEKILNEFFRDNNVKEDNDNYINTFLSDTNYITFDGITKTFTYEIYNKYKEIAIQNNIKVVSLDKFSKDLAKHIFNYGDYKPKDIRKNGEKGKGYIGVKLIN